MADREHYYPRKGNIRMPLVYSTLNRFGDPKHTLYGGKLDLGGCRTGAGQWWPDFGPTVRDFSPGGKNHPTESVFAHEVVPFTRSQSQPALERPEKDSSLQQFRHPAPHTEALWKSTMIMPYKSAGRRKCGETSNWRAALSTGCEGYRHGGRMPIFCKGPLLDNPDFHQLHPLKREDPHPTIHGTCLEDKAAAGTATGTCPVDAMLRSHKSPADLGMRDSATIRADKTMNSQKDLSHSMTFKAADSRLAGKEEAFTKSFRVSPSQASVSFDANASVSSVCSNPEDKLPNWIASRTVATRDAGAAGGQAGPTSIRRTAMTRTMTK